MRPLVALALAAGLGGGAAVITAVFFACLSRRKFIEFSKKRKSYPANVVVLHQWGRCAWTPSISPFVIKFETFLRMANIPYQNEHDCTFSSKHKIPWMTYDNVDVADSQFCIEYLNRKLDIDLNRKLSEVEKGIARAFQKMMEENFSWTLSLWRTVYDTNAESFLENECGFPKSFLAMCRKIVIPYAYGQGMGRHSQEEVESIAEGDLRALSAFLDRKKFLIGESPSEVDCSIFGFLAVAKWMNPGSPQEKLIKGELSNLSDYCDRMKAKFWPDWDDCITHGGKTIPSG